MAKKLQKMQHLHLAFFYAHVNIIFYNNVILSYVQFYFVYQHQLTV